MILIKIMSEMNQIVVSIKTFLRDKYLYRCVDSLLKIYPDIKIAICDDGRSNEEKNIFYNELRRKGHYIFKLPFNVGMTEGRNYIVAYTKERYILYIDDDFIFSKEAKVENFLKILQARSDVGMAAGRIREKGIVKNYQGYLIKKNNYLIQKKLKMKNWEKTKGIKYKLCDLAFNYYLIRREVFRNTKYDDNVKIGCAHTDFFMAVKDAGWKIAFTPDSIIDHEHTMENKNTKEYEKFRRKTKGYIYFSKKRGIRHIKYFNGDELDLIYFKRKIKFKNIIKKYIKQLIFKLMSALGLEQIIKGAIHRVKLN